MGISKNRGTPKSSSFSKGFPLCSPSILGYHYFRKHLYTANNDGFGHCFTYHPGGNGIGQGAKGGIQQTTQRLIGVPPATVLEGKHVMR